LKIKTDKNVSPVTRNTYRGALSAFFSFCITQGYIEKNPIEKIQTSNVTPKEIEFYKVKEIEKMLNNSKALSEVRIYLAIAAFAGLRRSEIERLEYSMIHFERRQIILAAKNTKTKQRRAVKINDTLARWLEPYMSLKNDDEKVAGENFRKSLETFRKTHNIKWINNGLRHSFGTYFFALTANEFEGSKQMGHSPDVFKKHYANQIVDETDAEKYFNISPTSPNK